MAKPFFGGVHPDDMKRLSCNKPIKQFPAPKLVIIPLSQHIGAPCKPLVKVGDYVTVGQKIGDNEGLCVPVHASVSGKVKQIAEKPHTSGSLVNAIVIENDEQYTVCHDCQPRATIDDLSAQELMAIIREAGIVGMGGAAFPSHVKLSSAIGKVDTLIVDAAECEPYITADDRLIREMPEKLFKGLRIVMKILNMDKAYIGIEANKPEAIAAMQPLATNGIEVKALPTHYPQGAEKQMIQAITGRQVPGGVLPAALGCAVINAATCAAICDAVYDGMPLVKRVVTVSGNAAKEPCNFMVPIGTPFEALIEKVGLNGDPYKIISGGPMMGFAQFDLSVPIMKGSNSVLIMSQKDNVEHTNPHCIRCGKCTDACPMRLMPLYLYKFERMDDLEGLERLHMMDCIECGSCAYICPAKIPLVQSFRTAKQKIRDAQAKEKAKA